MHRIERIESILCHLTMDKASCPIITGNHEASQQSTDYPIVHHQRKGTEQLRLSTGGKRRIADISQQVKHHHHQNPPPLIVHTRPSGETSYRKDDSPTKDAILLNASIAAKANTPNARVKSTLCVPSAPFSRYQGTSLTTANPSSCRKYFIRFRVCRKPSAMRKANTGKAMRPKQRMTS